LSQKSSEGQELWWGGRAEAAAARASIAIHTATCRKQQSS